MSTLGWVLLVGGVLVSMVAIALTLTVIWIVRGVRDLGDGLSDLEEELHLLRNQTLPMLDDARVALRKSENANAKVETLVKTAESLTGTVDSASRLAYRLLSNPLVKLLAFFSGTRRALSRLREITEPAKAKKGRFARAREDAQRQAKLSSDGRRSKPGRSRR